MRNKPNDSVKESEWIDSTKELPNEGENVEISDDGITVRETADYKRGGTCMLAGSAGGHGYFSKLGFVTDGSQCDSNLILDTPPFWRRWDYSETSEPTPTVRPDKIRFELIECSHPKEQQSEYHDSSVICNQCHEVIEQFGKPTGNTGHYRKEVQFSVQPESVEEEALMQLIDDAPSVNNGLDSFYGKRTVLNLLKIAFSASQTRNDGLIEALEEIKKYSNAGKAIPTVNSRVADMINKVINEFLINNHKA